MKKLTVYFIRHGTTNSNLQGRFCGRTDSLLAPQGWEELKELKETYEIPQVERIYSSPAIRCRETASVYYPDMEPIIKEGLWEFDFGQEEGVPASDFIGTDFYQTWLDQDPDCAFKDGETLLEASFRILAAMTRIVKECRNDGISTIAIFAHGAILARLMNAALMPVEQKQAFLLCPNGMGLKASIDLEQWFYDQVITFEEFFPKGAPRLKPEDSPYFATGEKPDPQSEEYQEAEKFMEDKELVVAEKEPDNK